MINNVINYFYFSQVDYGVAFDMHIHADLYSFAARKWSLRWDLRTALRGDQSANAVKSSLEVAVTSAQEQMIKSGLYDRFT